MRSDIHHDIGEPWRGLPKKVVLYGLIWLIGALVLTALKILTDPDARLGSFGKHLDVVAVVAFLSGFMSIMIYFVWLFVDKLYEARHKNARYRSTIGED